MNELDTLEQVIAGANHSPQISEQIMLCAALHRLTEILASMKKSRPGHHHTQALAHLRIALKTEQDLMFDMMERNKMIGRALASGDVHAS